MAVINFSQVITHCGSDGILVGFLQGARRRSFQNAITPTMCDDTEGPDTYALQSAPKRR